MTCTLRCTRCSTHASRPQATTGTKSATGRARQRPRSRHNLSYWTGEDWWGAGPGAHSHVGGLRWWNVKHPRAYAERMAAGLSPAHAREILTEEARHSERVLLETRIRDGFPIDALSEHGKQAVAELIADGLVDGRAALGIAGAERGSFRRCAVGS